MGNYHKRIFLLIVVFLINFTLTFSVSLEHFENEISKPRIQDEDFRLPTSIMPINYKLELMTILDPLPGYDIFTALGKVWIKVGCQDETSVITLHSLNLTIDENSVQVRNLFTGTTVQINGISYTEESDFLHIELASVTDLGQQYEIYIEFISPISGDRLNGMYQDFYNDTETGERRYIATTLFAPYHTRRLFPVFDEPSFRGTYDITLGHHSKYHAMSNADIIDTKPIENMTNWQWDVFATTPSISSYITAMIVSDLEFEEAPAGSFRNVTIRLYAKPESIRQGAGVYSANLTGTVMTFFESQFIIPYPISKLYSVALPQFFFSAMENWGLITFKEPVLLYLDGETTEDERYIINSVLSHENAHQYFGNLIAVKWWAYVWLKEGFATYYSNVAMNYTNPELQPWEQFIPKVLQKAMEFDSSYETHPLENYPATSAAIADIYTTIPYQKGASILRMASYIVTPTVFLSGIKKYVNTFQYKSAEQNDVFAQLQIALDESPEISRLLPTSVKDILDTWTTQSGYPVLKVTTIAADMIEVSQEKFIDEDLSNPLDTWWVPLYLRPKLNTSLPKDFPDAFIPQYTRSVRISIPENQTILVNSGAIGYYRVLYDPEILEEIIDQLNQNHEAIPSSARSQLLNDYFHFAIAGYSDFESVLKLTNYLHKEVELSVWQGVLPLITKLSKALINTPFNENFKIYFGNKVASALTLLENESNSKNLEKGASAILHSLLMKLACSLEDSLCNSRSADLLQKWMINPAENRIPLSLQEAVFCSSVFQDSKTNGAVWNFLHSEFHKLQAKNTFNPLKLRLLKGLACSENKATLQRLMEMVSKSEFNAEEKVVALRSLVDRPMGKEVVMEHLHVSPTLINIFTSNAELREFVDTLVSYALTDGEIDTITRASEELSQKRKASVVNQIQRGLRIKKVMADFAEPIDQWIEKALK